jgi:hypothetical protein
MAAKELSDAIRREMDDALNAARIWHIHAMGWLDADTPDPEFVGHAMWQTDPPIDIDWTMFSARRSMREPTPPLQPSPEWLKVLAVSGADFEGLMKAARMSIGLFLIQTKIVSATEFSDDDFFELHWMSAVIYLATASERIREFFIAAAFHSNQNQYLARGKIFNSEKRTLYVTPFMEAIASFSSRELLDTLTKFPPLASSIQTLRDKRNELIHELATTMGRNERKRLSEKRERGHAPRFDFEELQALIATEREARARKMAEPVKELADWYHLLLQISNQAFVFENVLRRNNNQH